MPGRRNARTGTVARPAEAALTRVANQPSFKNKKQPTRSRRELTPIKRGPSPDHDSRIASVAPSLATNSSSSTSSQRSKGKEPVVASVEEEEEGDEDGAEATSVSPRPARDENDTIRAFLVKMQADQRAMSLAAEQRWRRFQEVGTQHTNQHAAIMGLVCDINQAFSTNVPGLKEAVADIKDTLNNNFAIMNACVQHLARRADAGEKKTAEVLDRIDVANNLIFALNKKTPTAEEVANLVLQRMPTADAIADLVVQKLGARLGAR